MSPQRIQRQRIKGWRKPEGAVYVGRGTRWDNPFKVGSTQVRVPGRAGQPWEYEGRLYKTSGQRHQFVHGDGRITWHQVEDATPWQCVALFREWIGLAPLYHLDYRAPGAETFHEEVRAALTGRDLMCWCPLDQPCHADVHLALAYEEAPCGG